MNRVDELLSVLEHLLSSGFKIPFTGGRAFVRTTEGLEVIEELRACLPEELRKADDITDREEVILENAKRTAVSIIQKAEEKGCLLLSETEISKKAQAKAQDIISEATINAREIKSSTYKYLDELLERTEKGLQGCLNDIKTTKGVINQSSLARPAGRNERNI